MNKSDAAKILGLPSVFDAKAAKSAMREAARIAHPDKGGSHAAMRDVNAAYKLVADGVQFGSIPKIDVSGVDFKAFRPKPSLKTVVNWFAGKMLKKMDANRHKKFSWRKERAGDLYSDLIMECNELHSELIKCKKNKNKIIKECADVANFAMMIADNAKRKL